jgi:hypothetical protein
MKRFFRKMMGKVLSIVRSAAGKIRMNVYGYFGGVFGWRRDGGWCGSRFQGGRMLGRFVGNFGNLAEVSELL